MAPAASGGARQARLRNHADGRTDAVYAGEAVNVLFATDGSPSATRAQELVGSIDWGGPSRIELLHVDQLFAEDLELPAGVYAEAHERLFRDVSEQLTRARRQLEGHDRRVETKVTIGRAATAIVDEAKRSEADVVVMGSHGRGAIASALLGSVTAEVVDHAPCPVLVARTATIRRAVLGHDGSDGARQAEQLVATWPFLRRIPVRVVSAWQLVPAYASIDAGGGAFLSGELYQQLVDDLRAERQRVSAEAVKRLADAGVKAVGEVREASAARALIDAAGDDHADLIVVGSRGESGIARLLLGSVARGVLHAPCSVLVTRQRVSR